jgi:hypothetical protein
VAPTRDTTILYDLLRNGEGTEVIPLAPAADAQDLDRRLELIQQHLHQVAREIGELRACESFGREGR